MKTITIDGVEYNLLPKAEFKVGDWVVFNNSHNSIYQISEIKDFDYMLTHTHGGSMSLSFSQEWLIRPWAIADAKDGDVLYSLDSKQPFIYKERPQFSQAIGYCCINKFGEFGGWNTSKCVICTDKYIPATKEQRDLLFAKMREAGYEWNAKKKELKKIFKTKFKAGDEIKTGNTIETISEVDYGTRSYSCESGRTISFENQDLWHLLPKPHYDIKNFHAGMPVLVRETSLSAWQYVLFSHCYIGGDGLTRFNAGLVGFTQCIPFEGNEHLLGTTDMPDEMYINW